MFVFVRINEFASGSSYLGPALGHNFILSQRFIKLYSLLAAWYSIINWEMMKPLAGYRAGARHTKSKVSSGLTVAPNKFLAFLAWSGKAVPIQHDSNKQAAQAMAYIRPYTDHLDRRRMLLLLS